MRRESCPVCGVDEVTPLDHIERTPVISNRLSRTAAQAREVPSGTLDVVGCPQCGFVWNREFDLGLVPYDGDYENDQSHSRVFQAHIDAMIDRILEAVDPDGSTCVAEVGCGQGGFLEDLLAKAGDRIRSAVGFDPAFRPSAQQATSRVRVLPEYFDESSVGLLAEAPNIVISRHTIEHVPDPMAFLRTIRRGIGDTPARLFLETPDVRWILDRGETQDLFYEHCTLFDPHSLSIALKAAGFESIRVDSVFEGQYMWAEAAANVAPTSKFTPPPRRIDFPNLGSLRTHFVSLWRHQLEGVRSVVWGAGAKGVTFCLLTDPDATRISAVIDLNSRKHERFVVGTGHPVRGPEALREIRPEVIVVMNPNYRDEIAALVKDLGVDARLLTLGDESAS